MLSEFFHYDPLCSCYVWTSDSLTDAVTAVFYILLILVILQGVAVIISYLHVCEGQSQLQRLETRLDNWELEFEPDDPGDGESLPQSPAAVVITLPRKVA